MGGGRWWRMQEIRWSGPLGGCCETQEQCPASLGWLGWWGGQAESEGSLQDVGPLLHAER